MYSTTPLMAVKYLSKFSLLAYLSRSSRTNETISVMINFNMKTVWMNVQYRRGTSISTLRFYLKFQNGKQF